MRNILDKYFKNNPTQLMYFIKQDVKQMEKTNIKKLYKNKISKIIIEWKKKYKENILIKIYLDIIKTNNTKNNNMEPAISLNNEECLNNYYNNDDIISSNNDIIKNILKIQVNDELENENTNKIQEYNLESSCDAEYYESILPVDENEDGNIYFENINYRDNIIESNKENIYKNDSNSIVESFRAMDLLKKKIKNHFSDHHF